MRWKHGYIFAILFLLPLFIYAQPHIVLNNEKDAYTSFEMELLVNPPIQSAEEIKNIFASSLPKRLKNNFALGYDTRDHWFHITVLNNTQSPKELILELTEQFHKKVDLYEIGKDGVHIEQNGLHIPLPKRSVETPNPAFRLHFDPHESKDLYIDLASNYSLYGAFQLKSPQRFMKDNRRLTHLYLIYFGAMLSLALYNLFIFFYLRRKVYLYYVGHVLLFTFSVAIYKGFLLPYITMRIYDISQISIPLFFILLILFSQQILKTKEHFPRIHMLLNAFIAVSIISLIWILIDIHDGFYFMNVTAAVILPMLMFASLLTTRKDKTVATIYLIALLIFIAGMTSIAILALGLIDYSPWITNIPMFASFFEIVLFSLLLAYRINKMSQESTRAREELIRQQKTEKSRLFQEVAAKTQALNQAKKRLEKELEENKLLEGHLKHQATTDSMTGLMNRRAFIDEFDKELNRARRTMSPLSCLILDIDHFKQVNDSYGHHIGDLVIKSVAENMKEHTRTMDYIGRIGGEEFAILMPETHLDDAYQIADRLRDFVSKYEMCFDRQTIHITVSIGITDLRDKNETIESILQRADAALYNAKREGRNRVCSL